MGNGTVSEVAEKLTWWAWLWVAQRFGAAVSVFCFVAALADEVSSPRAEEFCRNFFSRANDAATEGAL